MRAAHIGIPVAALPCGIWQSPVPVAPADVADDLPAHDPAGSHDSDPGLVPPGSIPNTGRYQPSRQDTGLLNKLFNQ